MKKGNIKQTTTLLTLIFLSFLLLVNLTSCESRRDLYSVNNIKKTMGLVADWQISNFSYKKEGNLHDYGIDAWTNGVLYWGMLKWTQHADNPSPYYDWLMNIGTENHWSIPANFAEFPKYSYYHADELCVGQFYLGMYDLNKDNAMLRSVRERADWIIDNPGDQSMSYRNKQSWTWCDALFMAPPVYAHLTRITGDDKYIRYMHRHFLRAVQHLLDAEHSLFFRDDSYFGKQEVNGEKIFWGRGNGWVLAGLANILEIIPAESDIRAYYEDLFKTLSLQLAALQGDDGFWHASLLDPESYPSPETSATALITYGLAYGMNNGLLDKSYLPAIESGWQALISAIDENGKLGWVQPIGADPKKVTSDMTAVYGVGAFLMAGAEILNLLK